MGEEREEVRRKTEVKLFGLTEAELKTIATKYGLTYQKSKGSCWVSLEVPEAKVKIIWFN
jgi:hypothetical protein